MGTCLETLRHNSERDSAAQRFLEQNLPKPQQMFGLNVLSILVPGRLKQYPPILIQLCSLRSFDDVFNSSMVKVHGKIMLYCAGFPCTPYSKLHASRDLRRDPNMKQLLKVVSNIASGKPVAALNASSHEVCVTWCHVGVGFHFASFCCIQGSNIGTCPWVQGGDGRFTRKDPSKLP